MSDQTAARHSALTLAVEACIANTPEGVVLVAQTFLGFLNGPETIAPMKGADAACTIPAPKAAPAAKPAAAAKPASKKEPVIETATESEAEGPTAQDIATKINELLAADKQDEALAALKKYGAKSKSTLKEEHYADFLADAETILLSA
jgi:hypothetical protein